MVKILIFYNYFYLNLQRKIGISFAKTFVQYLPVILAVFPMKNFDEGKFKNVTFGKYHLRPISNQKPLLMLKIRILLPVEIVIEIIIELKIYSWIISILC